MATIGTLAEQILRILGARSDDAELDERDIKLNIKQSLAYVVRNRYFMSKQDDVAEIDGSLMSIFKGVTVSKDDEDTYCATLPCDPMSLPYGGGIIVSPTGDKKTKYKLLPFNFCDLYRGLDSARLENNTGYYIEGNKVYFVNMSDCNDVPSVRFGMLIGVDNLNEDKDFLIPADMEFEVMREVLQIYGAWSPEDVTNNSEDQI